MNILSVVEALAFLGLNPGAIARRSRSTYKAGRFYGFARGNVAASGVLTANRLYLVPFYVEEPITTAAMAIRIVTAVSSGNVKVAVWANNPSTEQPTGAPLLVTGSQSTTTQGVYELAFTASATLSPGVYWMGIVADATAGGTVTVSCISGAGMHGLQVIGTPSLAATIGSTGGTTAFFGLWVAMTFADAFPDLTAASFTEQYTSAIGVLPVLKAA